MFTSPQVQRLRSFHVHSCTIHRARHNGFALSADQFSDQGSAIVADERRQVRDAVVKLARGFIEILRKPVNGGRAFVVRRLVDRFDQRAPGAGSAHFAIYEEILKVTDPLYFPGVAVEQYAAALGGWYGLGEAELNSALPRLGMFPGGAVDLF